MAQLEEVYEQFEEEETEAPLGATLSGRKRLFSKELRCMMYGFGDDQNPYTESVDLLEDLVIEFITEMKWLRDGVNVSPHCHEKGSKSGKESIEDPLLRHYRQRMEWRINNDVDDPIVLDPKSNGIFPWQRVQKGLSQTHKAMEIGRTGRVQVEDIVFLVRKDARKYARVKDLLTMNEELKKARKAFDEVKYAGMPS